MIGVSAFKSVPPFAQGLVRDLRVRWALEEADLAYDEVLRAFQRAKDAQMAAFQPA